MGGNLKTSELLERFYAGQTSAAEEQELTGRLDEASAGDKALFRGLSGMRIPDENVPVPEDLSRMIGQTVDRELGCRRSRMRLIASVSAIGVAAAIAAVAFLTPLHIDLTILRKPTRLWWRHLGLSVRIWARVCPLPPAI